MLECLKFPVCSFLLLELAEELKAQRILQFPLAVLLNTLNPKLEIFNNNDAQMIRKSLIDGFYYSACYDVERKEFSLKNAKILTYPLFEVTKELSKQITYLVEEVNKDCVVPRDFIIPYLWSNPDKYLYCVNTVRQDTFFIRKSTRTDISNIDVYTIFVKKVTRERDLRFSYNSEDYSVEKQLLRTNDYVVSVP